MKQIAVLLILFLGGVKVIAQQDALFSQYMYARAYWNPALTGVEGYASAYFLSRSQWVGYKSTDPSTQTDISTQMLGLVYPFQWASNNSAVGLNILFDKLGPSSSTIVQWSMAQHFDVGRGTLSLGLRPSWHVMKLDNVQLDFLNNLEESRILESDANWDLDAGLSFSADQYTIGLSVFHIVEPNFDRTATQLSPAFNLYGDYLYQVSYQWSLLSSGMIRTNSESYTIDISAILHYKEQISAGLGYRHQDALVLLMGYSFLADKSLSLGYAIDFVVNNATNKAQTSHEIYLSYRLPTISSGPNKIIRTPRFRY